MNRRSFLSWLAVLPVAGWFIRPRLPDGRYVASWVTHDFDLLCRIPSIGFMFNATPFRGAAAQRMRCDYISVIRLDDNSWSVKVEFIVDSERSPNLLVRSSSGEIVGTIQAYGLTDFNRFVPSNIPLVKATA